MEQLHLTELLGATIDDNNNHRQRAEAQLQTKLNMLGFTPLLLQVVMRNDVSLPVRQAGAVCLKNMVSKAWHKLEEGEVLHYKIHEQDRARVRDVIVEAVVQAPELLRVHLCLTLRVILECDFPSRWTHVVDKIQSHIQNPNPLNTMGALKCLYSLIKNFEYSSKGERGPLNQAMVLLLPILYQIMVTLERNLSVEAVLIKKQILKCYFTLIKNTLSLELHTREVFSNWMRVLCIVLIQPVPESTLVIDEEQRQLLPWWKLKKWSINTLFRLFDRYGSPISARAENLSFSRWYVLSFTNGILSVLVRILEQYGSIYVSPLVLQQTLVYINHCVRFSYSWHLLKPSMPSIIENAVLPILSFKDADQLHWNRNPEQYFSIKNETLQDYVSPIIAAQMLLTSACSRRKGVVENTMHLCTEVLNTPNDDSCQRDGALHMIGILHTVLMKKPNSNENISTMLEQFVFPEFDSIHAHMRARAAWVVQRFSKIRFRSNNLLYQVMQLAIHALLHDRELPVQAQAAIAIQMLLSSQERARAYLEPQIREITAKLLDVISQTGNEKIANFIQNIVPMYSFQLQPMAYEITDDLATSFSKVMESDASADQILTTAKSLLDALETCLSALGKSPEKLAEIEMPVLIHVIGPNLLRQRVDYYQKTMALMSYLTATNISEVMWNVLPMLCEVFRNRGRGFNFDFYNDMIPTLINFLTVDTTALISNERRIRSILDMTRNVLALDQEDESEWYAAKVLEVIVLEWSGRYDFWFQYILEVICIRLSRVVRDENLKLMYIQVVVGIFYKRPLRLLSLLEDLSEEYVFVHIVQDFVAVWLTNSPCLVGIHDRRLCVLAMCVLLNMGRDRPPIEDGIISLVINYFIIQLSGLKRAYELQAEEHNQSSNSDGVDQEEDILSDDEDDHGFLPDEYYGNVSHKASQTTDTMNDQKDFEPTAVERFKTSIETHEIDEFIVFKRTMHDLSVNEPDLYLRLHQISAEETRQLNDIYQIADQRKARLDRILERKRGYSFTAPTSVPRTFRFGRQPN